MSSLAPGAKPSLVYVIGELYILPDEAPAPACTSQVILPKECCYSFPGFPTTIEIQILNIAKSILPVRDPRRWQYPCTFQHS